MKRIAVIFVAIGFLGGAVWAAPITYTQTVTGTGTLGASAFTNALVTLTLIGDTSNVLIGVNAAVSGPTSATVNVFGVGTGTFTDDIEAVDNRGLGRAGFSDLTSSFGMLFTDNAAFLTYTLQTSIGPLSGPATLSSSILFPTNSGNLHITSISGNSTFTATTVPEPTSLTLIGAGLLALTGFRLRKHSTH